MRQSRPTINHHCLPGQIRGLQIVGMVLDYSFDVHRECGRDEWLTLCVHKRLFSFDTIIDAKETKNTNAIDPQELNSRTDCIFASSNRKDQTTKATPEHLAKNRDSTEGGGMNKARCLSSPHHSRQTLKT